jgi:hypothetical protein
LERDVNPTSANGACWWQRSVGFPTKAVLAVLESASGFANQSQSGAHTGGQSSGQAGSAATSGLMQNLNMLQTLDMARSNWNEMLIQRVQWGLLEAEISWISN